MIKEVNIKTSIPAYKKKKENAGKVALYDTDINAVVYEGDNLDWEVLQDKLDMENSIRKHYHMILVPSGKKLILPKK